MNPTVFLILVFFLASNPSSGNNLPFEPLAHWYTPRLMVPVEKDLIFTLNMKQIENIYTDLLKTCVEAFPECHARCYLKSKPLDKTSK